MKKKLIVIWFSNPLQNYRVIIHFVNLQNNDIY